MATEVRSAGSLSQSVSEQEFSEGRKSLTAGGVFVFSATSPPSAATQGFLGYGIDEPRDEAQPGKDVDRREELAERGGRSQVAQAHGRQRGDAEVEGVHHAPTLHRPVEKGSTQ